MELEVNPFAERVRETGAIRTDGSGGDRLLVKLDEEIEITKRVVAIFFDVLPNVGHCIVVKGWSMGDSPVKNRMVEKVGGHHRVVVGEKSVCCGVVEVRKAPGNVLFFVDADGT